MKRIQFIKSLVVVFLIAFLPFGIMIWFRIHQSSGFAALELITYPLIFGGGSILLTIILKKYFLKESLTDFNSVKGNWT